MNPSKKKERQINILLVEDDEVDVMNLQRAFKKNKISNPLYIAGDGLEALDMLRNNGTKAITPLPQIILLDLNMPRMNGIEFLEEIRKDERLKPISVIVLTTSNEERDLVAAYNFNVAGYILKPIDFREFTQTVTTLDAYWSLMEMPQ